MKPEPPHSTVDLPNFCQPRAVLLLVVLGLLLALLLALAARTDFSGFWNALGLAALFVESVILSYCLLLCAFRGVLVRLPVVGAFLIILGILQALVAGYSWLAARFFLVFQNAALGSLESQWILRNVLISLIASVLLVFYLSLHRRWQLQVRAESSARLEALQARIRPHFLFNTLNTIANLVRSRPEQAEQAVLDLSDLLRTGLRGSARHSLADELELVRGYLRIESQRLGPRLSIVWRLTGNLPLAQSVPVLLIQPLVENAIVHGIARCADGGSLGIQAELAGSGHWRFTVENPLPPVAAVADQKLLYSGNNIALENIRQRLELAYGERARLKTTRTDRLFKAELTLPIPDQRG